MAAKQVAQITKEGMMIKEAVGAIGSEHPNNQKETDNRQWRAAPSSNESSLGQCQSSRIDVKGQKQRKSQMQNTGWMI